MPTTTLPEMGLVLPVVGQELEPQASTDNNAAFTVINSHDHTTGHGVKVPTAGLNINQDLSTNSYNLTNVRGVRFNNSITTFTSADKNIIYDKGGDIWWNNNAGTAVQVTNGSSLNITAANVLGEVTKNANYTILVGDTFILALVDSSGGAISITLPAANGVTAGRYYIVKDSKSTASTNNITIIPAGADTIDTVAANKIINANTGSMWLASDGVSNWNVINTTVQATATVAGAIRLAGDLGGTATIPRVVGINSATVPAGGALTTGNVLKVSGAATLTYGAVNLAGGANHVTGLLPSSNLDAITLTSSTGTTSVANNLSIGGLVQSVTALTGPVTYTVLTSDAILNCDTTGGAIILNLPATPTTGHLLRIFDIAGNAHTNNISVVPAAGKYIQNVLGTRVLTADYGSWTFINTSGNNWFVI